jgi:hypothetical protein
MRIKSSIWAEDLVGKKPDDPEPVPISPTSTVCPTTVSYCGCTGSSPACRRTEKEEDEDVSDSDCIQPGGMRP